MVRSRTVPRPGGPQPEAAVSTAVLIVNYRSYDALAACLDSLRRCEPGPLQVVVVDQEADPLALGRTRRHADGLDVVWIERAGNSGFGAGVNEAARQARGADRLLVLNPDCFLVEPIVTQLGDQLTESRTALVAPRVLDADGRLQQSARAFPGPSTLLAGRTSWLSRWWPGNPLSRANLLARPGNSPTVVDWVSGACMLVDRDAFEQVGGFDEGFFLYWEDADLCRRLWSAGYRVLYDPRVTVVHQTGRSAAHAPIRSQMAFHRSVLRYVRKHHPHGRVLLPVLAAALAVRLAARTLASAWSRRSPQIQ